VSHNVKVESSTYTVSGHGLITLDVRTDLTWLAARSICIARGRHDCCSKWRLGRNWLYFAILGRLQNWYFGDEHPSVDGKVNRIQRSLVWGRFECLATAWVSHVIDRRQDDIITRRHISETYQPYFQACWEGLRILIQIDSKEKRFTQRCSR